MRLCGPCHEIAGIAGIGYGCERTTRDEGAATMLKGFEDPVRLYEVRWRESAP